MVYHVSMTLHNIASSTTHVVIPKGTLFEVVDPFAGVQNLVTSTSHEVALGPGDSKAVVIDAWCFNRPFTSPDATPMRLTMLTATPPYTSQSEVWLDQANRR